MFSIKSVYEMLLDFGEGWRDFSWKVDLDF